MKVIEKNIVPLLAGLMEELYAAKCEPKKTFDWLPTAPRLALTSPLARIYRELTGRVWRNSSATRAALLTVDAYFGPPLNLIFEFDEDRHFNPWRARTIELYPPEVPLNFDVRFYLERCFAAKRSSRNAKDLAFHDALVDLLPPANGLNPTLRIAQAELADSPREEVSGRTLEERLVGLLDKRLSLHAGTTFLQMLEHPSAKPWVPRLVGSAKG